MAILGGSPLGLIGITSNPSNGYSTFNGGKTRNVAVSSYNQSKELSLFTGKRKLRAWPGIKSYNGTYKEAGKDTPFTDMDTTSLLDVDYAKMRESGGKSGDNYSISARTLHNNDVYDTSVLNIIEKLSATKAALRPSDFAYLKNLGVYPNNRLMVVRRFATPSDDNIMVSRKATEIPSIANVIGWVSDGSDFVDITFGEVWAEAKADFTNMLNRLGEDFGRKTDSVKGLGDLLGAGAGAVPLPGFTEIFQRKFLAGIGLLDEKEASGIPAGNPNLIKEAKVRTTVGYGDAGSGLSAKVSFTFETEYELKFISGIDPTIVWLDIIGNVLRLGTSESDNYGLSKAAGAKIKKWVSRPDNLVAEVISTIKNTLSLVKTEVLKKIEEVYEAATKAANDAFNESNDKKEDQGLADDPAYQLARSIAKGSRELLGKIVNIGNDILRGTILKYRTEIIGIVNALTGAPSTPWHITIGNPLRPIFCSGDMYVSDVNLKLGPQLAFNDLPSSIKVSFTIQNARNLGLQEIMSKFNSGYLRTVDVQKTYYEISDPKNQSIGGLPWESAPQVAPPDDKGEGTKSADGNQKTSGTSTNPTNGGGGNTPSNTAGTNASGGNPAGSNPTGGNTAAGGNTPKNSTKVVNGKQAKTTINKNVKTKQK